MLIKILILLFTILIFTHFYEVLVDNHIIEEFGIDDKLKKPAHKPSHAAAHKPSHAAAHKPSHAAAHKPSHAAPVNTDSYGVSKNPAVAVQPPTPIPEQSPTASTVSTYTPTGVSADPTVISKINASNITYLKTQTDLIPPISKSVDALNEKVKNNTTAILALSKQTSNSGFKAVGRDPTSKKPLPMYHAS